MKNIYFYFKLCVMMLAFFWVQSTQADNRLRAIIKATESCTYEFYNGDILVQTQIVLNGEKLLIPETPKPADSAEPSGAFIGWFEGDDTEAFSFSNPINVTETKTVKLRARYSDKVYVHFIVKSINDAGDLKVATTKEVKKGEAVNVDDIPIIYPDGKKLTHWTLTPDADGNGPIYDFATGVTENISLYAVYTDAWRVYFRMRGGKSILPKYYDYGATLDTPNKIVPDRDGYDFKGWTTVNPGEASDDGDDTIPSDFADDAPVTKNLVLYALWNKGTATYKVARWQQNADDNGYSFVEIKNLVGNTGSEATYKPKNYHGFILNEEKTNEDKPKIDGFGTTVKHVFYDRETYTLSFKRVAEDGSEDGSEDIGTFSGVRYGAKTDEYWNQIADENPGHLFSIKTDIGGQIKTLYYTHPPRMQDKDFDVKVRSTSGDQYIVYYKDKKDESKLLDPFSFKYKKTTDSEPELTLSPMGTSVVEGFTQEEYVEGDSRLSFVKDAETRVFEATRYFTRNSNYKITFLKKNGEEDAVAENISFEEALDEIASFTGFKKGETKRKSDNFIFGGWFTAEETHATAEEFVFEGKGMPAYDIILYAKWLKPTYKVYFHPNNDKNSDPYAELQYEHNTVIPESVALDMVSALTDPTLFFKWFWYPSLDRYVRYDFGMPITEDVHLYPTWDHPGFTVTYKVDAGTGTAPVDNNKYFVGKDAIVKPATADMKLEGKVFVGWKLKSMSGSSEVRAENRLYIPGEKIVVDKNITLYDWWEDKPQMTEIIYDANGGIGDDITVALKNNETHVTKPKETFTKDKQEIKSWNTKPGGDGTPFEPGVSVIVNNNPETPNKLYAQWGNTTGVNTVASNLRINYYPNPVLTTLTIQCEWNIVKVEILDALGKSVRFIDAVNTQQLKVDFSDLNTGLYYVRVFGNDEKTVFKVIKK